MTALLDALADCLGSGDTLFEALDKIAIAGGAAHGWTQRIRRSVRAEVPLVGALRDADMLDDTELSLFSVEGADDSALGAALGPLLRAVALRRRRRQARWSAIGWGLVAPFAIGVLTVLLDPLPNLISGGPYLWPAFTGLSGLALLTVALAIGVPALFRNHRTRTGVLRLCVALPGARRLAALYAEEELTTALAPFVDRGEVSTVGLRATASLLAWSPLGDALRVAAQSFRPPPLPMGGLEPLAHQLSLTTNLAIVGGVASKHLAERLAQRGAEITQRLTAQLRRFARIGAYTLVVVLSVISLVGMIARGLPSMFTLPGGASSPDEKQLEDLLKQLEP